MQQRQHEATERASAEHIDVLRRANAEQAEDIARLRTDCAALKRQRDELIDRIARLMS
jgi:hypothetical protein